MSKSFVCPKCGHVSSTGEEVAGGLVAGIIAGGLVGGLGLLVGGPVGAAVGGGYAAKLVNRACKETGKAVALRCPKCGSMLKKND